MSKIKPVLVSGSAGFIGARTAKMLLDKGRSVVGVDNLNDYYDVRLKKHRLAELLRYPRFKFYEADIENLLPLRKIFQKHKPGAVLNLAARAGVRYSMENPFVYVTTNTLGTLNLLDCCREHKINKFVLASTSSLYAGQKMPFKEARPVNTPISPYAASKQGAEALCYSYHYLYGLDVTVLRYFTVYGPAGRPDMSVFRFIKWIHEGKPVHILGTGRQSRDFTYVDDIAGGTLKTLSLKGFQVVNLGSDRPYPLMKMIRLIETYLGKKANLRHHPKHKTDMDATWADIGVAKKLLPWKPVIGLDEGIRLTVAWYLRNQSWLSKLKV